MQLGPISSLIQSIHPSTVNSFNQINIFKITQHTIKVINMLAFINMPAMSGEVYITSPDKGISLNNQQRNKINHLLTCHIYKMRNIDLFF